jgi:hypothetical protein
MMAKMRIPRGDESQPREYEGLDGSLSGNVWGLEVMEAYPEGRVGGQCRSHAHAYNPPEPGWTYFGEETMDTAGMQWQHRSTKHKIVVTSGKWENCQWGSQADSGAGSCKAGCLVFHQTSENEWQDIVEELARTHVKGKAACMPSP